MRLSRFTQIVLGILIIQGLLLTGASLAQDKKKPACGPDHAILYKRAVNLLDKAEKKLAAKYTAEAKALLKECNSLFTILLKECGPEQKTRALTSREEQQEAVNKKLAAGEMSQADRLEKSASEKLKKSEKTAQQDLAVKYAREAKVEFELAQVHSLKAGIYSLRNQQMLFRWLAK